MAEESEIEAFMPGGPCQDLVGTTGVLLMLLPAKAPKPSAAGSTAVNTGWSLQLLSRDLFLYFIWIFLLASGLPTTAVPEHCLSPGLLPFLCDAL